MLADLDYNGRGITQHGVGLLTAMLIRYSELASIHYCCEQHALTLIFMLNKVHSDDEVNEFLHPAIDFFHQLEGRKRRIFDVKCQNEEGYCLLTITRDIDSMTQKELGLIVEILKKRFEPQLVYEKRYLSENERIYQEDIIDQIFCSLHSKKIVDDVTVLRDDGKVLILSH